MGTQGLSPNVVLRRRQLHGKLATALERHSLRDAVAVLADLLKSVRKLRRAFRRDHPELRA